MRILTNYQLVNEPADPVWVRDVDSPQSQPVQFNGHLNIQNGTLENGLTEFFRVPRGKRLVIRHVSARADNLASDDSLDVAVTTTVNGITVEHYLGLVGPQGRPKIDPHARSSQILSKEVRLYADSETHVSVGGSRVTRQNDAFVVFAMSGYFVNVQSGPA
jgi:hypothetical protein